MMEQAFELRSSGLRQAHLQPVPRSDRLSLGLRESSLGAAAVRGNFGEQDDGKGGEGGKRMVTLTNSGMSGGRWRVVGDIIEGRRPGQAVVTGS